MNSMRREWWVSAIGVAGTAAIHAVLITSLTLGTAARTKPQKPDDQGAGASVVISSAEPVTTMILLDLSARSLTAESTVVEIASRGSEPKDSAMRVVSPDANPAFELDDVAQEVQEESRPESVAVDGPDRAILFGRYMGQMSARIERAWLRPRTAVNGSPDAHGTFAPVAQGASAGADDTFDCQVHIIQNSDGNVLEVMLLDCNGSTAWQASLVAAIQQASPLPFPPHPSVFVNRVTLRFQSRAYTSGDPDQGYEFEPIRLTRAPLNEN